MGREARMKAQNSETNHLNNPITMPERTRPTENEMEDGMTPPQNQKPQKLTMDSQSLNKKVKTLSGVK